MQLEKYQIQSHNEPQLSTHYRKLAYLEEELGDTEQLIEKLTAFQIAIPSWALGTGGTRFGRFSGGGEPRNLEDKMEDIVRSLSISEAKTFNKLLDKIRQSN